MAALENDIRLLNSLGFDAGAGVRLVTANTPLFEKLINTIHEHALQAKFRFNTEPTDTAEAVQRWFPTSSVAV